MGYIIVIFEVLVWLLITAILAWFKYQFLDLINKLPLEWQLKERLLAHRAGKGIKFLERNWMHECIRIHHRHLCLVLQITIFAILETNLTKYFVTVSTSAHYSRQSKLKIIKTRSWFTYLTRPRQMLHWNSSISFFYVLSAINKWSKSRITSSSLSCCPLL